MLRTKISNRQRDGWTNGQCDPFWTPTERALFNMHLYKKNLVLARTNTNSLLVAFLKNLVIRNMNKNKSNLNLLTQVKK